MKGWFSKGRTIKGRARVASSTVMSPLDDEKEYKMFILNELLPTSHQLEGMRHASAVAGNWKLRTVNPSSCDRLFYSISEKFTRSFEQARPLTDYISLVCRVLPSLSSLSGSSPSGVKKDQSVGRVG